MITKDRIIRILVLLGIIVIAMLIIERLWAFGGTIANVLSTLVGAWFLAFAVRPFIDALHRSVFPVALIKTVSKYLGAGIARDLAKWRLPYGISVAVVYIALVVFVVGAATFSVAAIIPQATGLINRLPEISSTLPSLIVDAWASIAQRFGFDPAAITSVVSAQELGTRGAQLAGTAAQQALLIVTGTATLIGQFFLMLILSLYIVTEGKLLERQFYALLPSAWHQLAQTIIDAINRAFGGYLRGYIFSALIRAGFSVALFGIFGVNFGIVLALVYAILSLIPLIGSPLAILIAAIVTLVVRPDAELPVLIILLIFDQVVAYAVVPRIMSNSIGVPGLIGLLSISLGVQLFGFWGLILSVPAMGVGYTLLFDYYLPRRRKAEGLSEYDAAFDKMMGFKRRTAPSEEKPQETLETRPSPNA